MDTPYRFGSRLAGKRVVTLGGGTGPFAILSNLKNILSRSPLSFQWQTAAEVRAA